LTRCCGRRTARRTTARMEEAMVATAAPATPILGILSNGQPQIKRGSSA
jgi:hypothetical protein